MTMNKKYSYYFSCILGSFLILIFCTCKNKVAELSYCTMYETDQSYVNTDKSDMELFNNDREKRIGLIQQNFDDLIDYAKWNGFPKVEPNLIMTDSCKYWAVTMTMLHTAQTNPELFFSEAMSSFFISEVDKGNIRISLLQKCIEITKMTTSPSEKVVSIIDEASRKWGLLVKD